MLIIHKCNMIRTIPSKQKNKIVSQYKEQQEVHSIEFFFLTIELVLIHINS